MINQCLRFLYFCEKLPGISFTSIILNSPMEYLKGVGPQRADLLKKELNIYTFRDLLEHFPFRHVDKSKVSLIEDITPQTDYIQLTGRLNNLEVIGHKGSKRMVATLKDSTGTIELVWFQGISWVQKNLLSGQLYLVYGRVGFFQDKVQIVHPEMEAWTPDKKDGKNFLEPVYPTTEKMRTKGLGGKQIGKLTQALLAQVNGKDVPENLPQNVISQLKLIGRYEAYRQIHFPSNDEQYEQASRRLKFEELFLAQIRMNLLRSKRHRFSKGVVFDKVGELFNTFYKAYLPFELTDAQKRVINR